MTEWPKRSTLCINYVMSIKLSPWSPSDESSLNTTPRLCSPQVFFWTDGTELIAEWNALIYVFSPMVSLIIFVRKRCACSNWGSLKSVHLQYKGIENPTNSLILFTLISKQNVCHTWNPIILLLLLIFSTLHNGAIRFLFFFICNRADSINKLQVR